VPTIYPDRRCEMVGTLRFAHPTKASARFDHPEAFTCPDTRAQAACSCGKNSALVP
jgi:hypothetical protein